MLGSARSVEVVLGIVDERVGLHKDEVETLKIAKAGGTSFSRHAALGSPLPII